MNETIVVGALLKAVGPVLNVLVNIPWKRNSTDEIDKSPFKLKGITIKTLVEKAKGVLDKGKGLDLESLTNLATILTEGEIYGDIIKYISHRKFEGKIKWDKFVKQLVELEKKLSSELLVAQNTLDELEKNNLMNWRKTTSESQSRGHEKEGTSSGHEKEGVMPPRNVRRLLLYLSHFPKNYVFNRQRISRLLVAHEFIVADSGELPCEHLANWLEPVGSSWDGDQAPNHFRIGNNVEKFTQTWPENHNLVREALAESIESIEYKIFRSSLIFLVKSDYTLEFNKDQFLFLKVLSLRNGTLGNEECLKTLSFLKYLDLKNTKNVRNCSWLEGLEELEMLDLRYTSVKEIPDNCLEKLGKLQHLLLGYRREEGVSRLAGPKLNTKYLKSENLETLRAIRLPDVIEGSVDRVVDLSVTGLDTQRLKEFWNAVGKFQKLTSLGVSVTENTVVTLEDCPDNLKNKLERLRMEGQIFSTSSQPQSGLPKLSVTEDPVITRKECPDNPKNESVSLRKKSSTSSQPQSGLAMLSKFRRLIDLTLASDQPISIPTLTSLRCLRLYGFVSTLSSSLLSHEETICEIDLKGFIGLKKVVIGDMKKVKKIQISSAVIGTVTTLKLCHLPNFRELVCLDTERPLLRRNFESKPKKGMEDIQAHKTIFLKGFDYKHIQNSRHLKIYHYDM